MRGKIILLIYLLCVLAINVWLQIEYISMTKESRKKPP